MWEFGCGLFLGIILGFLVGVKCMTQAVKDIMAKNEELKKDKNV